MAIVKEERESKYFGIKIEVLEYEKDESNHEPWKIIDLDIDGFRRYSPKQLRGLGKWLIKEGKRIGREYTGKGRKREIKE